MNLIEIVNKNKVDYNKIINENIKIVYEENSINDISFIVPLRGRGDFLKTLHRHFLLSKNRVKNLNVDFTVVEHSQNPESSKFCKQNKINYIWLKSDNDELFDKCLSMNIGALFGPKTNNFLFHDVDCIMQGDFFERLLLNIKNKNTKAIQCFSGRRVLYLSSDLTSKVISGELNIDDVNIKTNGVSLPMYIGAPGGSIFINKDLFLEVGGYDVELFKANSPEDAFFWDKIEMFQKMDISDSPTIELFHMNHPPTYYSNPRIEEMKKYYECFKGMSVEEKIEYIKNKKINQ